MLIQFSFQNFKSFRDNTILDLTATKQTEHDNHIVKTGNEKLLPLAAIYGANASGKSNVLNALNFMTDYVLNSFSFSEDSDGKNASHYKPQLTPFLFDASSQGCESGFEVYFISPDDERERTFNYGFTLTKNGIVEEWLNVKSKSAADSKRVFYRNEEEKELELPGIPAKLRENIRVSLSKQTLVISLGALLQIPKLKEIQTWFQNISGANFGDPLENAHLSRILPDGFADDAAVRAKVVDYFSTFDPSIVGFNVDSYTDENGKRHIAVDALHKMIDTSQTASIPLKSESDGTLKMLALYPFLQKVLEKGSVLFVDELNARLHPLLVRNFLLAFLNPKTNPNHAQLIFTTHDVWQLKNNLLRRDEIWFTEKAPNGVSSLYSLAEFVDEDGTKIRKDESFERNYLLGKYGGIPTLRTVDILEKM